MIKKYDNHLTFDLPYGYEANTGINDDGSRSFSINCGAGINSDGEPTAEVKILLRHLEGAIDPEKVNFNGDFPSLTAGTISEMGLGISIQSSFSSSPGHTITIQILIFMVGISCENDTYALIAVKTSRESSFSESCELIAKHMNRVLGCLKLDSKPGNFQKLTGRDVQRKLKERKSSGENSVEKSVDRLLNTSATTNKKTTNKKIINDRISISQPSELVDPVGEAHRKTEELQKAEEAKNSDIPIAKPLEGQHTHLDFLNKTKAGMSMLGGLISVNQTGTEFSLRSIGDMADDTDNTELSSICRTIADADQGGFDLVDTAHDMAELFRVNVNSFDGAHDREQEIKNGLIQRVTVYETFRSFAWTLQAYCEKENLQPVDLSIDTIRELVDFIADRNGLNYTGDSYSPAICSGDDIHVYYIPDNVPEDSKKRLLKTVNADIEDNLAQCGIASLDALRKELDYMYPAIKAIYDELEADRDSDFALTDGISDILYAWCSMAYAAREPIFSEDGPVNCWWEHPDEAIDWDLKFKMDSLEWSKKRADEWMKEHAKDITPNAHITIKDKLFVFSGVTGLDEWLDILQRLTDMGGIHRTAVSGKTNYLVCNPADAGDSQIRKVKEQRIKGNDIKIVLFDDFLKAIGMTVKSPEEKLAELKAQTEKKESAPKRIKEVVRTAAAVTSPKAKTTEDLTYNEHLQAKGEGYVIDIPDGFTIKEGEEDRDFIAYLPNDDDPDSYLESKFIIFAGKKQENDIYKQLRTVVEYTSIIQGLGNAIGAAFSDTKVVPYEREDLPGAIVYGFDTGALHANAFLGIDDHVRMMRVQINDVNRKNKAEYEVKIKELFDRMSTPTPVTMLKHLDADEFIGMPADGKKAEEWIGCIGEYVNHFRVARNIWQNALTSSFQQKQSSGNADVQQLKKDIKNMLKGISQYVEAELKRADVVYTLKRAQYPSSGNLGKMKKAVESLIDLATQYVNLDEQQIKVESEYAKTVQARMTLSAAEAADQILSDPEITCTSSAIEALNKAKEEYAEIIKAAEEEKRRKAEERRRREAEERKRVAEEMERKRREEEKYNEWEKERDRIYSLRKSLIQSEIDIPNKKLSADAALIHKEYEEKYVPAKEKKKELETTLAKANEELSGLQKMSTTAENIFLIFGLVAVTSGIVGFIVAGDLHAALLLPGVLCFLLGALFLFVSILSIVNRNKRIAEKKRLIQTALDGLAEIPDIPTIEQYAQDNKDRLNPEALLNNGRISKEKEREIRERINRENPIPPEPPRPASYNTSSYSSRNLSAKQTRDYILKEYIVDALSDGDPMTVSDMIKNIPELEGDSNQHVSALCRALVMDGRIEKYSEQRRTYFRIS